MRVKNVFILCTGRCGSTTFTRAFSHATNYTSGHETRTHRVAEDRFAYPEYHIEADNRLSWLLGRLDRTYGRDAFYVHLTRDVEEVAASFVKRWGKGIIAVYHRQILMGAARRSADVDPIEFARDYVDTVTENIRMFLRDKPNQMNFRLETGAEDTRRLWQTIGAEGDLQAAIAEWDVRHNASPLSTLPGDGPGGVAG